MLFAFYSAIIRAVLFFMEKIMRVLSGIQPSGKLHIANYFGMMKRMIEWQEKSDLFCFIVNLHALTSVHNAERMREGTLDATLDFLALGLDPDKSTFWIQSDIPEHTELAWYLSNVTPHGLLERSHAYKDKVNQGIVPNFGLFAYPVLMAADILLYQTELVPVGKDQKQHVEMARDIAIKFNNTFGETFVVPDVEIPEEIATIPGTDGKKMSKSYGNTIDIFGEEKVVKKSVMSIVTDSIPVEEVKDPDTCNVYQIFKLFLDESEQKEWDNKYRDGGMGYGDVKKALFERVWSYFAPHRKKREELQKNMDFVYDTMNKGKEKAQIVARETIELVRKNVGMDYKNFRDV